MPPLLASPWNWVWFHVLILLGGLEASCFGLNVIVADDQIRCNILSGIVGCQGTGLTGSSVSHSNAYVGYDRSGGVGDGPDNRSLLAERDQTAAEQQHAELQEVRTAWGGSTDTDKNCMVCS